MITFLGRHKSSYVYHYVEHLLCSQLKVQDKILGTGATDVVKQPLYISLVLVRMWRTSTIRLRQGIDQPVSLCRACYNVTLVISG